MPLAKLRAKPRVSVNQKILAGAAAIAVAIAGYSVQHFEGTRYIAYRDVAGVYTICEGHTLGVKPGDTATPQQCEAFRSDDVAAANDAIDRCVKVPLSIGERAAYIDFVFNVGPSAFCGSTLVKKLNSGQHVAACDELLRWTFAGGKQLPGLVTRRQAEHKLCKDQTWSLSSLVSSPASS